VPEEPAVRNVAHQQLDDNEELVYGLVESRGESRGGGAADGLLEVGVGGAVVELHDLDAAEVVVVARKLGVAGRRGEGGLRDELVGLVIEAVLEVAAEKTVDEGGLRLVVVSQGSSALGGEE
jgi:hypothetical protein